MASNKRFASSPYPGLRPFETEESDIFFGREQQTDELLVRLHRHRFLAVVGPSGCGKSSLVRAGMIAGLKTGFMCDAGSKWRTASMRPGEHPLAQLAAALLAAAPSGTEYETDKAPLLIQAALRRGPLSLIEVARELDLCQDTNLLILVDQFEELFRFRKKGDPNEADAFVALLLNTAARRDLPIYIVITMRSDFLGDCALFRDLPEAINDGQYLTPRLTREQCAAAICGPARVFGGDVDDPLVNQLLNDFGPDPDQLPVLQHALMRMWHRRLKGSGEATDTSPVVLTVDDYESIGGLQYALSRHADEVLADLTPEQQRVAQILFRRLTERGAGRRDTRAPARLQEIADIAGVDPSEVIPVVEAFRRGDRSFLTPRDGPLESSTLLDIGHESLIRQWHTLSHWVEEEGESAAVYARMKETARLWKKGSAALWGTPDLEVALAWKRDAHATEEWALRYGTADEFKLAMEFLTASRERQRSLEKEVHEAYLARIRRANRRTFGSAVLALAMAVGVLLYLYLKVLPYTAYFHSYERVKGAPQGIGKLSSAQREHRPWAIKITRQGRLGPVLRMEVVDRRGKLTKDYGTIPTYLAGSTADDELAPVRTEYTYDSEHRVMQEIAFDLQGNRVSGFIYLPPTENPLVRTGYYVGPDGYPIANKQYSNHAVEIEYDANGYEKFRRYKTRGGNPARGPYGAFGQQLQHDAQGRVFEETSLGSDYKPMDDTDGNATWKVIRFNALGEDEEAQLLDAAGHLTVVTEGYAIRKYRYDSDGNLLEESYFDASGRPTHNKDGYHRLTAKRDDRGNAIEVRFWDDSSSPATGPEGTAGWDAQYDDSDNPIKITWVGQDGKPAFNQSGYAMGIRKFDTNHHLVDVQFFDTNGQPVLSSQGCGRVTWQYDDKLGRIRESACFLADKSTPALTDRGYARTKREYDQLGREVKRTYLGKDGKPTRIKGGYAAFTKEYDAFGNIAVQQFLDENGKLVRGDEGMAGWTKRFDADGRELEMAYLFPTDGDKLTKEGIGGKRSGYDEKGNEIERSFLGVHGEPLLNNEGVAGWKSTFDELGRKTDQQFVNTEGKPATSSKQGYARVHVQYDHLGNTIEYSYFDVNGNLVMAKGCAPKDDDQESKSASHAQCARKVFQYSDQSQVTEESYFGTHGELVPVSQGWARAVNKYDKHGNRVERSYYGVNKQPFLIDSGYYSVRFTYNDQGKVVKEENVGLNGQPGVNLDGWHIREVRYDPRGNAVETSYFGSNGQLVKAKKEGYAREVVVRDQQGREVEKRQFDANGKQVG